MPSSYLICTNAACIKHNEPVQISGTQPLPHCESCNNILHYKQFHIARAQDLEDSQYQIARQAKVAMQMVRWASEGVKFVFNNFCSDETEKDHYYSSWAMARPRVTDPDESRLYKSDLSDTERALPHRGLLPCSYTLEQAAALPWLDLPFLVNANQFREIENGRIAVINRHYPDPPSTRGRDGTISYNRKYYPYISINCFRCILLAAVESRIITQQQLFSFVSSIVKSEANWLDSLTGSRRQNYYLAGGKPLQIIYPGDIVFFNGTDHVVLALGEKNANGEEKVVSFWGNEFRQNNSYASIEITTIEQLIHNSKVLRRATVTYARAPWNNEIFRNRLEDASRPRTGYEANEARPITDQQLLNSEIGRDREPFYYTPMLMSNTGLEGGQGPRRLSRKGRERKFIFKPDRPESVKVIHVGTSFDCNGFRCVSEERHEYARIPEWIWYQMHKTPEGHWEAYLRIPEKPVLHATDFLYKFRITYNDGHEFFAPDPQSCGAVTQDFGNSVLDYGKPTSFIEKHTRFDR